MLDDATQKNLLLFDEVLAAMQQSSQQGWKRSAGFVPLFGAYKVLRPYIENLALYCNEYLGAKIEISREGADDMVRQAAICQREIAEIHRFIGTKIPQKNQINLYDEDSAAQLADLWRSFDNMRKEDAYMNRYFLRGSMEFAAAVLVYRREASGFNTAEVLENEAIAHGISEALSQHGIDLEDDKNEQLVNAVYDGCENLLNGGREITSEDLDEEIYKQIRQSLPIEEHLLKTAIAGQKQSLWHFISKARKSKQKNQAALRRLLLLAPDIKAGPHEDMEQMIYLGQLQTSVPVRDNLLRSDYPLPDYLKNCEGDERLQAVLAQLKTHEHFEKQSENFDKEEIYAILGRMNMRRLGTVYENLSTCEDNLQNLTEVENDEIDFDDENDENRLRPVKYLRSDEVIDFALDLEQTTRFAQKYSDLNLNKTGVDRALLMRLKNKSEWCGQEAHILDEFVRLVGAELDDNLPHVKESDDFDMIEGINKVVAMPHGEERQEALTCVIGSMQSVSDSLDEETQVQSDEIDNQIGYKSPDKEALLQDFLNDGVRIYADLKDCDTEALYQQIHQGVLNAYVIPEYLEVEYDGDKTDLVMAYVDDYDNYQPETQKFLHSLSTYYADKIMPFHREAIKKGEISDTLEMNLESYDIAMAGLQSVGVTVDELGAELAEENKIMADYRRYQQEKAMYEQPKIYDLMLAAILQGRRGHM